MDLEDTFGWIGCALTTCFFLPQLIPFINICKGKLNFEDAPGYFISISYINSFLWMIYGEEIFSDQVKITNFIACLICLIAMIIYLCYEIKKYVLDSILNFLIIFMASWAVYKYLFIEIDDDGVVGKLCFCSSLLIYSYYGYIIYRVINEKNYMLIQFHFMSIYFVGCMIWIFFGIVTKDLYVVFPYSMGFIISLVQIVLYINYEKKYPTIDDKEPISGEVEAKEIIEDNEKVANEVNEAKIDEKTQLSDKGKPVKIISKINKI